MCTKKKIRMLKVEHKRPLSNSCGIHIQKVEKSNKSQQNRFHNEIYIDTKGLLFILFLSPTYPHWHTYYLNVNVCKWKTKAAPPTATKNPEFNIWHKRPHCRNWCYANSRKNNNKKIKFQWKTAQRTHPSWILTIAARWRLVLVDSITLVHWFFFFLKRHEYLSIN